MCGVWSEGRLREGVVCELRHVKWQCEHAKGPTVDRDMAALFVAVSGVNGMECG